MISNDVMRRYFSGNKLTSDSLRQNLVRCHFYNFVFFHFCKFISTKITPFGKIKKTIPGNCFCLNHSRSGLVRS